MQQCILISPHTIHCSNASPGGRLHVAQRDQLLKQLVECKIWCKLDHRGAYLQQKHTLFNGSFGNVSQNFYLPLLTEAVHTIL